MSGDLKPGDRVVLEDLRAPAPANQPAGTVRMRIF